MKKSLTFLALSLFSMTLVGCNTPEDSTNVVDAKLAITVSGDCVEGATVTLIARYDDAMISQTSVVYTAPAEYATISGNKMTLLKVGTFNVTAVYTDEGGAEHRGEKEVTVVEYQDGTISIADAKAKADGELVTVKGKVTASAGTSAYISDGTDGIFVYNWFFNKDDSAINNKSWTVGDYVEVCAKLATHDSARQLSSYSDGRIAEAYAHKLDVTFPTMDPIKIDEAGFKALKDTDCGKMYTFDATYVSNADIALNMATNFTVKIGSTEVICRTNGNSTKMYDPNIADLKNSIASLNLTAGDAITVTTPLSSKYGGKYQFSLYSGGSIVTKK